MTPEGQHHSLEITDDVGVTDTAARRVLELPVEFTRAPMLWHYTGAEALVNILCRRELWATAPLALNDSEEVSYGTRLLKEIWTAFQSERPTGGRGRPFAERVIAEYVAMDLASQVYVLSSSTDGDLGSMWHNYARNGQPGGYALGFSPAALTPAGLGEGSAAVSSLPFEMWLDVVYDRHEQEGKVRLLLKWLWDVAGEEFDAANHITREFLLVSSVSAVAQLVMSLKEPGFVHEREARLVLSGAPHRAEQFRVVAGHISPYISIGTPERVAPLPITEVVCGPPVAPETTAAVRRLLDATGHTETAVKTSVRTLR